MRKLALVIGVVVLLASGQAATTKHARIHTLPGKMPRTGRKTAVTLLKIKPPVFHRRSK